MREKGIVHLLIPIILVIGLVAGLYLVQNTQIFKPKAFGGPISGPIVNVCRSNLTYFSVSDSCTSIQNGFRRAYFSCEGSTVQNEVAPDEGRAGGGYPVLPQEVCKPIHDWVKRAVDACASICPSPTPTVFIPSPTPNPNVNITNCSGLDGNLDGCNATPGCAYYLCSDRCMLRGTPNDIACNPR